MDQREREEKELVGYKKPPRHSQFKPGQSGNPKGRPKKVDSVADVLRRELSTRIAIVTNGRRLRVPILRAIIKQHLNKAATGDVRAMAVLFDMLKSYRPDSGDNLSELVQEFRAIAARHAEDDDAKV